MVRTSLLDVNVLISLLWTSHPHHSACRSWFDHAHQSGWATCAITEAGLTRVISNPSFAEQYASVHQAIDILSSAPKTHSNHVFWNNDLPIAVLTGLWRPPLSHNQITDAYLLCLAHRNKGTLVTFDRKIQHLARTGNFPPDTVLVLKP